MDDRGGARALVTEHRNEILDIARRHRGQRVRLFGSVARGEDRQDSDIDFLVDFAADSSLFDLMHLTRDLEQLLGRSVDVISVGGLKPGDEHILTGAIDI